MNITHIQDQLENGKEEEIPLEEVLKEINDLDDNPEELDIDLEDSNN